MTNLAQQVPVTWTDKWNAWRYLAMLGNLRTHLRNLLGNGVFTPAVWMKNAVAAGIEGGVDAASKAAGGKVIERTKDIPTVLPGTGEIYRGFSIADFERVRAVLTGGGKMNSADVIRDRQQIFRSSTLEWLRRQNFNLPEAEDGIFLGHHYMFFPSIMGHFPRLFS